MAPTGDIDYIIMTNAHEESRLAELLADFSREYPDLSTQDARRMLLGRLIELVTDGRIGVYAFDPGRSCSSHEDYYDLSVDEAIRIMNDDESWAWAPSEHTAQSYCLLAIDQHYWGTYFGTPDTSAT